MRWWALGLAGFVALVLAAAWTLPAMIDLDDYKAAIATEVARATGRDLAIDGAVTFELLPSPRLTLLGVRLGNIGGAAAPDMVRISSVDAHLALRSLLRGRLDVTSLSLVQPVVTLERLADGRTNWTFDVAGPAPAMTLEAVTIRNGTVILRDAVAGTALQADRIDLDASVPSLDGPITATGTLLAGGVPISVALRSGPVGVTTSLGLDVAVDGGALAFTGSVREGEVQGTVDLTAPSFATLIATIGGAGPRAPGFDRPLAASGAVLASRGTLAVTDLAVTLGELRAKGATTIVPGTPFRVDGAVAISRVDLDGLVAGGAGAWAMPSLAGLAGRLDASIDAVTFRGGVAQQVQAVVTLESGTLAIERASALLPGGSDLTITGSVSPGDVATFSGTVEAASDDLRGLIAWLGVDPGAVSADRLRKIGLVARVKADPTRLDFDGVDLRLDGSRITGSLGIAAGPRPRVTADVAIDRLNLDAYVDARSGRDALAAYDADVRVKVDQLAVGGAALSGVTATFDAVDGVVTVADLAVADVGGASVRAAGTFDAPSGAFGGTYAVQATDLGTLLATFGIAAPWRWAELGAIAVEGRADGDPERVNLEAQARADGATLGVTGTVTGADVSLALAGALGDPGALGRALFGRDAPDATGLGPLGFQATLTGRADDLDVRLGLAAAAAVATVRGNLALPAYDLAIAVTVERPGGHDPYTGTGSLRGDDTRAALADLAIGLGNGRLDGDLAVDLEAPRPTVDARLRATGLDVAFDDSVSLDLDSLRAIDGAVAFQGADLMMFGALVDEMTARLRLADGTVTIESLAAATMAGTVRGSGTVVAARPTRVDLHLEGEGLGIGGLVGGLDIDARLQGNGTSAAELFADLGGSLTIAAREAVIAGFDLDAYGDDPATGAALHGGSTAFADVAGSFAITRGRARTDDLRARSRTARAEASGAIDLASGRIDLIGSATFAARPGTRLPFTVAGTIDDPLIAAAPATP